MRELVRALETIGVGAGVARTLVEEHGLDRCRNYFECWYVFGADNPAGAVINAIRNGCTYDDLETGLIADANQAAQRLLGDFTGLAAYFGVGFGTANVDTLNAYYSSVQALPETDWVAARQLHAVALAVVGDNSLGNRFRDFVNGETGNTDSLTEAVSEFGWRWVNRLQVERQRERENQQKETTNEEALLLVRIAEDVVGTAKEAVALYHEYGYHRLLRQLAWLPFRGAGDPADNLRKSLAYDWTEPKDAGRASSGTPTTKTSSSPQNRF